MKKIIFYILVVIVSGLTIYFEAASRNLAKDNIEMYQYFSNNQLLDANNRVNLAAVNMELTSITNELKTVINKDTISEDDIKTYLGNKKEFYDKREIEIKQLLDEIDESNSKIANLEMQYGVLNNKYSELKSIRDSEINGYTYLLEGFPTINQYPDYPTGCESVALAILLRYYGIWVSPSEIINNLAKGDLPHMSNEDGQYYGGNPELEFVGSPYNYDSYGVYHNPIAKVASMYKDGVISTTDLSLDSVLKLVKEGHPVIAWTSMYLAVPFVSASWIYQPTNETVYWKANEHAVVIIGFNNNNVIISDPIDGLIKYQSRSVFESRYNYYGNRVIYY